MRDPNRIKVCCERLQKLWEEFPDWRFGQLFENTVAHILNECDAYSIFFIEDDKWFDAWEHAVQKLKEMAPDEGD